MMRIATRSGRAALIAAAALAIPSVTVAVATIPEDEVFAREGRREIIHIRIQEGCDEAATDRVDVEIPEGVLGVIPQAVPGWTVTTEIEATEPYEIFGQRRTDRVSRLTWAGGPLAPEQFQDFGFVAVFTEPTDELAIPVVQGCGAVAQSWDEEPQEGESRADLRFPAPVVRVVEPPETDIPGLQVGLREVRTGLEDLQAEFDSLRLGEIPGSRLRDRLDDAEARLAELEELLAQAEDPDRSRMGRIVAARALTNKIPADATAVAAIVRRRSRRWRPCRR